jgi:hypothetical protein
VSKEAVHVPFTIVAAIGLPGAGTELIVTITTTDFTPTSSVSAPVKVTVPRRYAPFAMDFTFTVGAAISIFGPKPALKASQVVRLRMETAIAQYVKADRRFFAIVSPSWDVRPE